MRLAPVQAACVRRAVPGQTAVALISLRARKSARRHRGVSRKTEIIRHCLQGILPCMRTLALFAKRLQPSRELGRLAGRPRKAERPPGLTPKTAFLPGHAAAGLPHTNTLKSLILRPFKTSEPTHAFTFSRQSFSRRFPAVLSPRHSLIQIYGSDLKSEPLGRIFSVHSTTPQQLSLP
jgi:hypothetical protein